MDILSEIWQAIASMFSAGVENAPSEAGWLAIGLIGISIGLISAGVAWFIKCLGEGSKTFLESLGGGIGSFFQAGGMFVVSIGEGIKAIGTGAGKFIATPAILIEENSKIAQARIMAEKQEFQLGVTDGQRSVQVKLTGDGATQAAAQLTDAISAPTRALVGGPAVRVLTQNPSNGDNS